MINRVKLIKGDITTLKVDSIVNAANRSLLGGGGVDGAIHRAAGPALLATCSTLNGCETGAAKITKGFNLPAKYVIHTVGPVWRGGNNKEAELLASCYRQSLLLAAKNHCESLAFPNISTGVYGFPKILAAKIAVDEVMNFLSGSSLPATVTFCCFDDENYELYFHILKSYKNYFADKTLN